MKTRHRWAIVLTALAGMATLTAIAGSYPAGYQPQYTAVAGQQSFDADMLAAVKDLTVAIRENTAARKSEGNAPLIPLSIEPQHVAVKACAPCHAGKDVDAKGDGFRLFDDGGEFTQLQPRERQRVASRVSGGTMPPAKHPVKLTDAERKVLADYFRK